jgi:signal transduction histidine kinase
LSLPPETTGTKIQVTLRNAVRAARALVPNLKRIALVGDRFERQSFFRHYAQELGQFVHELEFIDLLGLPLADVKQRVATLPDDAAILFSSLSVDGAGVRYLSRDALKSIAEVANRPIVSETGTHIGYGSTGGFVVFPEPIGQSIARIVLRILDGERASKIPVVASEFARPVFDWRQLQRFGISAAQLPEGREFRFRPATMWEQYRPQVTAGLAALLLQAIIISWLLVERRRRYCALAEATDRRREVVRLNRVTTANVLSSSIAHELNQPLGAILSNTEAAQILLKANPPDLGQIGEILSDIVRDEQRASEIIVGLRNLLKNRTEIDLRTVELNGTVRDGVKIIAPEMEKRGVVLRTLLASDALPVRCDPIHLQQVMINLVVNGMDAMDGEPGPHNLTVRTRQNAESDFVEVRISDSGKGIPESNLTSIFDAFVTTKAQGTGLGLPIARTILESYGGDIWAENRQRGVVFSFRLPLARTHAG